METETNNPVVVEQQEEDVEERKVKEQGKKPFFSIKNPIPKLNLAALAKKLSPTKKAKEEITNAIKRHS